MPITKIKQQSNNIDEAVNEVIIHRRRSNIRPPPQLQITLVSHNCSHHTCTCLKIQHTTSNTFLPSLLTDSFLDFDERGSRNDRLCLQLDVSQLIFTTLLALTICVQSFSAYHIGQKNWSNCKETFCFIIYAPTITQYCLYVSANLRAISIDEALALLD